MVSNQCLCDQTGFGQATRLENDPALQQWTIKLTTNAGSGIKIQGDDPSECHLIVKLQSTFLLASALLSGEYSDLVTAETSSSL